MISGQALFQCIRIVVCSLDQRLASDVVLHGLLGRIEDLMVRSSRSRMNQAARNPGDEEAIVDL